ncbi:hypothetical protein D2T29_19640 [Sinirhodobacter populi]|uniref:Mu-like prophage FluMu N-terminal domain-containing protein n=1 Tax=Paenirhodobacter populi TaxID=2306993 RepID=A0A443K241_9RHOB|nr:hypothetical protein [Sinirhodobacter populi]RWR26792.1 hypothetical protein D2T29_19640 [Sinirhodobacter populi]
MARKSDTNSEVNEKPQEAAALKTPAEGQAGTAEAVPAAPDAATVETALSAIVTDGAEQDIPFTDATAASGGGLVMDDDAASVLAKAVNSLVETPAIRVIGPKRGRWRIGRRFGSDPVDIPLDDLSEEEARALSEDPLLTISVSAIPTLTAGR